MFLPVPTVSSLYIHIDIVNNSLVNNSDAKYAFLRTSKMDEVGAGCFYYSLRGGVAVDTSPIDTGRIKSVQNPKTEKGGLCINCLG